MKSEGGKKLPTGYFPPNFLGERGGGGGGWGEGKAQYHVGVTPCFITNHNYFKKNFFS